MADGSVRTTEGVIWVSAGVELEHVDRPPLPESFNRNGLPEALQGNPRFSIERMEEVAG